MSTYFQTLVNAWLAQRDQPQPAEPTAAHFCPSDGADFEAMDSQLEWAISSKEQS